MKSWTQTFAGLAPLVSAAYAWTSTPFIPHSYPLAVRSPYLSAWLPQGEGTALNGAWPQFWTGSTLGWAGFVKVDDVAYSFLGAPVVSGSSFSQATQQSATFTSTQTTFVLTAGGVDLTVNFLSPVEPSDLVKQSIPFSYMAVTATPNDGASHSVQIYSDISAEWASGDDSLTVNWTTTTGDILTHQVMLETQEVYTESSDHIQQGAAYYATTAGSTSWQTGQDVVVRAQFISGGVLENSSDTNFRAVSDDWPVFAFSHDLGTISEEQDPVLFAVGHVRDPAIEYIVAGGATQDRSLYFWSQYSTVADLISDFIDSYSTALSTANALDAQIESDASAISTEYAGIVADSVRQAFGATELTISKNSDGSWNTDDVMMFLKEISSDGNVNTVDVIFPAFPAFLYTNPDFVKLLILPLFEYQASGQYPNAWAVHDMGASYPKALGHNDGADEAMPLEECGNMLIMTLGHFQKTGDDSIITAYASLLDQWTQYLIEEALIPADQISTDDFAGSLANQTNLAIKGIIGIQAMADIWSQLGNSSASSNYSSIAASYVTQWQVFATSSDGDHLTLNYGNASSWGLSYNLYADKLLGTNLFPDSVYEMQASWYPTVKNEYGVPLDTRHTYTKSDWQCFTAAMLASTSTTTRDDLISGVYAYASAALSGDTEPFSDWYDTESGLTAGFRARPVAGGHLALLTL